MVEELEYSTEVPPAVWVYIFVVSVVTFGVYGVDKYRAIHGDRRIPEMVLHGLALIGGTVGALAGMYVFRHKTRKFKFRLVFILIVVVQAAALSLWIVNNGQN